MVSLLEVAKKQLQSVGKYHHRNCRICKEEIYFRLVRNHLSLISCTCREEGQSCELPLTWDEMAGLLGRHDHADFQIV